MADDKVGMGILGCGDYVQRWEQGVIKASERIEVRALFDPAAERAEKMAAALGGRIVESEEAVYDDPDVEFVCLFGPPTVRPKSALVAAEAGKHILATKPLAPNVEEAARVLRAVEGNVLCALQYRRTNDALMECCKDLLEEGSVGSMALYRQDWLHHYPVWSPWGTDPDRGGGPFMDAMIHNMNRARYLAGSRPAHVTLFSHDLAHPDIECDDTECMILEFDGGAVAHLFITWAADLAVYSEAGNDREHIDVIYMVTDQGWRLTEEADAGGAFIRASRGGEVRDFRAEPLPETGYDAFAYSVQTGEPLRRDLVSAREAYEDVKLVRDGEHSPGVRLAVDLSLP